MGELAVELLLEQLRPSDAEALPQVAVAPELIVRESTGPARQKSRQANAPRAARQPV
jgi:DNA-binding LacI/PurR family transcriptional regulator